MPPLESVTLEALFTMLKGEPGTRKSTEALSYPTPQYWISTDQKMEALELPAKRWGIWGRGLIDFDDYTNWDAPIAKLRTFCLGAPGSLKYKTIIVDSVTSIGDNINRQTLKDKAGTRNAEGGEKGMMVGSIPINTIQDYKAEASAFQELMAVLKDIHKFHKVNIVLIAHVVGQRQSNEDNKMTHHSRVIITGGDKISGKIASYCTEVYHFNITPAFNVDAEGAYGLYTVHTGNDYARTSLPLERRIEFNSEPLYDRWIKPAIDKLTKEKPIQRIQSQPTQPTQSTTQPPTQQPTTIKPFGVS